MANILLISDNPKKIDVIKTMLIKNGFDFNFAYDETNIIDIIKVETPDIIIFDNNFKSLNLVKITQKIKSFSDNIMSLLIFEDENISPELEKSVNAFMKEPISENVLISTINANLRTKNSLEMLANSNKDLAKSLYQLNVLYNTSSQFAGTLNKEDLTKYLIEGIDKSLGFNVSCTLTFKSKDEPILIINSLYQISERLLEALKLRAVLNFRGLIENKECDFDLNIDNLKIVKNIKHPLNEYDLNILRFNNLISPINLGTNFFGYIEIYRENEFSADDETCFQTLTQQVSLPLKSASLYEEIKKTNQKLEKLERLKSEFISIVSHELRTPLTSIKNSLDIILGGRAGKLTETIEKFSNMAKRNAVRLSGIINDLLDLSKIEAGKMEFKFAVNDIQPLLEDVKTNLIHMADEKNIKIILNFEKDLPKIYSDNQRLEQVLVNLISNAIKFTEENGEIEICAEKTNAKNIKTNDCFKEEVEKLSGDYLQICVKDNGIGIAEENLRKVFDKFAQIENSLSRKVGGTGLGLPITRQLLDSHNGAIWCESTPNKGSQFFFVIPVANEKTNFNLNFKQKLQKARSNNLSLALIKIKENNDEKIIEDLIENKIINKKYLSDSILEKKQNETNLTMIVQDGDKYASEFLNKKIQSYIEDKFVKSDIMFTSAIYPDDAIDENDLLQKISRS